MQMTRGVTSNERHHAHHYGSTVSGRSQRLLINTSTAKTNKQKKTHPWKAAWNISSSWNEGSRSPRFAYKTVIFSRGGVQGSRVRARAGRLHVLLQPAARTEPLVCTTITPLFISHSAHRAAVTQTSCPPFSTTNKHPHTCSLGSSSTQICVGIQGSWHRGVVY